jgi:hypothetical protein
MAREVGQMANIYQQSHVAIMASRAKSAEEGFLHQRFPFGFSNSSMGFSLPYKTKDGKTGSVIAVEEEASIAYVNPLRKRGWAFQEFVLSPRILDYGEMGTTWICQSSGTLDDGFSSPPPTNWSRLRFHELETGNEKPVDAKVIKSPDDRLESLHKLWTVIVQQYMQGALTSFGDRLPALGGIAERMSIHLNDDYVAGGWKSCIWESLMWHNWEGPTWERLPEYFAPSWSWASIPNGNIGFISTYHSFPDEGFQVLDCQVEPVSKEAKYGAVKSGFLTVCGRAISARYTQSRSNPGPDASSILINGLGSSFPDKQAFSLYLDATVKEIEEGEITFWLLCVCWDYKRNKICGLFLRQQSDGTYIRWGLFSLSPTIIPGEDGLQRLDLYARWRSSLPTKTLTIV